MLYLVSTPIGNLEDISFRAIATLKQSDLILCEDTRHSKILLNHYQITTPLKSFHQHNESALEKTILEKLKNGDSISIITDAGTPLISDPGHRLVSACIEKNLPFTAIPGACSPIGALTLSGMDSTRFEFCGFIPKTAKQHEIALKKALCFQGTSIFFESPNRIIKTIQVLQSLAPKAQLCIARELTKKFEQCLRGTPEQLLKHFNNHTPKGEIVLMISHNDDNAIDLELDELMQILQQEHGLDFKQALKMSAKLLKKPKNYLYKSRLLQR